MDASFTKVTTSAVWGEGKHTQQHSVAETPKDFCAFANCQPFPEQDAEPSKCREELQMGGPLGQEGLWPCVMGVRLSLN
jgi:hypothetical protein